MVIFTFAFYQREETVAFVFPGILWVAIIFAGMLAIGRTFAQEQESGCLRALALIPNTQTSLYCAKLLVNLIFMALFEAVLVPLLALAFSVDVLANAGWFLLILMAGTVGFAALGTLISAMLVHSNLKDVLLPLVLFPLAVPLVIGGVKATGMLMGTPDYAGVQMWALVMLAIDAAFLVGSLLMFRWVLSAIE
jgi:heme exporter protein B